MIRLEANTDNINNGYGDNKVGVMMGILGVQYSVSYEENLFYTSSMYAPLVDNDKDFALSVAHNDLYHSA